MAMTASIKSEFCRVMVVFLFHTQVDESQGWLVGWLVWLVRQIYLMLFNVTPRLDRSSETQTLDNKLYASRPTFASVRHTHKSLSPSGWIQSESVCCFSLHLLIQIANGIEHVSDRSVSHSFRVSIMAKKVIARRTFNWTCANHGSLTCRSHKPW